MKKQNLLIIFQILMILTSCGLEKKDDTSTDTDTGKFEKSELLGQWIRTNKIENSEQLVVSKINLKEDFTAKVEILDSLGHKTVNGTWGINQEIKMGLFTVKSDIALTFDSDDSHRQIVSLSIKEHDNEKVLTAQKGIFEKE